MALIHVSAVPILRLSRSYRRDAGQIGRRLYDQWSSAPSSKSVSDCLFFFPAATRSQSAQLCLHLHLVSAGPGSADQKEASPFVIEWIPDVLPRCQMGELRIGFEFGHQQSGQPEHCEKASAAEKVGRSKSDSTQSKHAKAVEILQVVV